MYKYLKMRCFLPVCCSTSQGLLRKERTNKVKSGNHPCSFGKKCIICYFKSCTELNFLYKVLCNVLTNNIDYLHTIFHRGAKARIIKTNNGQNSSDYNIFFSKW